MLFIILFICIIIYLKYYTVNTDLDHISDLIHKYEQL